MDVRSLRERDSQDTFVSLLQLDPAPMESPEATVAADKELLPLPGEASARSSGSDAEKRSLAPLGLNKSPVFYRMLSLNLFAPA